MENRGYRAETNQHEEMEMSVEMSEIISQTLNVLYAGILLCIKNMGLCDLRGSKRSSIRHRTFYQESYNLPGEKRCQHINKLDFNTHINKKRIPTKFTTKYMKN